MADDRNTRRLIIVFAILILIILVIIVLLAIFNRKTGAGGASNATGCSNVPSPGNVTAITIQTTKIKVAWSSVPNADAYKIYVGTVPGFTKSNSFADYTSRTTEFTIDDLTLGRTYYIFVESINVCGNASTSVSATVSTELKFPDRFQIVSRSNPGLGLKIAPDFQNIILDNLCTGVGLDNLCIWKYDQNQGFIVSESIITNCMKTYPAAVDLRVKYEACGTISYYNYSAARQWIYTPSEGTLCNPQNPEGLNCIKIAGPVVPGQNTTRVPYDGSSRMQWDIVEVL